MKKPVVNVHVKCMPSTCIPFTCRSLYVKESSKKIISSTLQVWSLEKPDWTCKIDEGLAGLVAVQWSPDGRHILSTADFQVCACVEMHCKTYTYVVLPVCCIEGSCNVYWQT